MATQVYSAHHPLTPTKVRGAYEGYSWTTFFWGPFPALLRGDAGGAGIGLLIWLTATVLNLVIPFSGLIAWAIWAGMYNENHLKRLDREGYVLVPFTPIGQPEAA